MKTVTSFSPGHVTGLFYVPELPEDPLLQSSIGAGFSVSRGMYTKIRRTDTHTFPGRSVGILIDGRPDPAPVSHEVLKLFKEKTGTEIETPLLIEHESELPHGAGFGTSGAGALGLSIALNCLCETGLTENEAAGIAHTAEVRCKTGLGTVMGELTGGLKLLVKQGAPGFGETSPLEYPDETTGLFINFGDFHTKKALGDPELMDRINILGRKYHETLKRNPTLEKFLDCVCEFSRSVKLLTPECREVLSRWEESGIKGGMHFFGNGVFTLADPDTTGELEKTLKIRYKEATIFTSRIEKEGCRIVSGN